MRLYVRKEFFGSVVFNSTAGKYFHLSADLTEHLLGVLAPNGEQEHTVNQSLLRHLMIPEQDLRTVEVVFAANQAAAANRLSAPLKVFFNITNKCKYYCKHCYNMSGERSSLELSGEFVLRVLDDLQRHGIMKVTLSGGEPLYHSAFDEVLDYMPRTDLSYSLITNGSLVTTEMAERLGSIHNLMSITVSLDGAVAHDSDAIRGQGAYRCAIHALEALAKKYPGSLAARVTIAAPNIERVAELPRLLRGIGVKELKVNSINPYGRANDFPELLLSPDRYVEARARVFEAAEQAGVRVEIPSFKYSKDKNDEIGLCRAGEEYFEISGSGDVYPCSFSFGKFLAGNVMNTPFETILLNLQQHSINNPHCYACKGRGGKKEKVFGYVPALLEIVRQ